MTKHTPGPWSLNKYGEPVDANGENIRAKGLALTNTDEAKANSVLIAAAPDLLDALQRLLEFVEAHTVSGEVIPYHTVEHVRATAAIAKATA